MAGSANTLKVLFLDDSPSDAALMHMLIAADPQRPVSLRHTTAVSDTLAALEEDTFDAVLMDLNVLDSFGFDTFQAVHDAYPNLPIVALTGQDDTELTRRCMEAGAQDYIVKGQADRFIPAALHNAVMRARLTEALQRTRTKLERSNRALALGQDLNRLFTREKSIQPLLHQACRLLTDALDYRSAWAAIWERQQLTACSERPIESDVEKICDDAVEKEDLACLPIARSAPRGAGTVPSDVCARCRLRSRCRPEQPIVASLRHDETDLGALVVSVRRPMHITREEVDLIGDAAADLSVAIRNLQLEESLHYAYEEFAALYSHTPLALFLVDEDRKIRRVNQNAQTSLALSETQALGQRSGDALGCIHAASGVEGCETEEHCRTCLLRRTVLDTITNGTANFQVECPITIRNGEETRELTFLASTNRITVQKRKQTLVCLQDVTKERRMQASLAQSDRLAAMGMLAAGVAHEINNPLVYVMYNMESLATELPEMALGMRRCYDAFVRHAGPKAVESALGAWTEVYNPILFDEIVQRAEQARAGTERIRDIARGLGTFTRVERTDEREINLNTAIESALNMAYNEIKYRARVVKDLRPVPDVRASEGRLAQVFLNLLINASHAIEPGNIGENTIFLRTYAADGCVFAEVEDTGGGISPKHLPHLFEPFFTTKAKGRGTGLGLYISNNIVTELGGEIQVTCRPGHGTKFTVRLPAVKREASDNDRPRSSAPPAYGNRGRILVVDDEALVRDTLVRMLHRTHDVVTASSGKEGRSVLTSDSEFDAVVCDLIMPDISGVDLYEWLTGVNAGLAAHMIFISGGAFTERTRNFLKEVDNSCLEKPFNADQILHAVHEAMNR